MAIAAQRNIVKMNDARQPAELLLRGCRLRDAMRRVTDNEAQ